MASSHELLWGWPDLPSSSPSAAPHRDAFTLAGPPCTRVCAKQRGRASSPAGACWASSPMGFSHFLSQSLYKQKEKARADLNTQIAEDTLRNCRGEKYTVLSLCRGGVFIRSQQQRWNRSCVINKSSASLPGRAHKGWSLTPAPNSLESCWKHMEISRCSRNSVYLELH